MVIERMLLMSIPMTMLMQERTMLSMLAMLMLIMLMSMQMKTTMLMLMPAPLTAQLPEGRRRLRLPRGQAVRCSPRHSSGVHELLSGIGLWPSLGQ